MRRRKMRKAREKRLVVRAKEVGLPWMENKDDPSFDTILKRF